MVQFMKIGCKKMNLMSTAHIQTDLVSRNANNRAKTNYMGKLIQISYIRKQESLK